MSEREELPHIFSLVVLQTNKEDGSTEIVNIAAFHSESTAYCAAATIFDTMVPRLGMSDKETMSLKKELSKLSNWKDKFTRMLEHSLALHKQQNEKFIWQFTIQKCVIV